MSSRRAQVVEEEYSEAISIPIDKALLCVDCDTIYHRKFSSCPVCTNVQHIALSVILQREINIFPKLWEHDLAEQTYIF